MFAPDPKYENLAMLYMPSWDGLVEGPTWDAWWIQNSYGPTYALLPFLQEPFVTFLQHAQDLWFDQMGDGKRVGAAPPYNWVAPDGCLCDCARPGWIIYRQGDGRVQIHDWAMEFTAAGILLQSELLLISHDAQAIAHYLPKLERCANFIETRRDPTNNLFLAGPAANLLAPSYAGCKKPDGTYGKAYLTGLSVTYIAALDRLIELEKLAGHPEQARLLVVRRDSAKKGLALLTTKEGYFIRSLDPDGTRHGVYGATRHGYFEASPNHDAIAFRVVDHAQAERIYDKIASIPGLRPYGFILPNYPSYDDMYEKPTGLWAYGTWVNGGAWSTCEARMMLAYYRLGKFKDARRSMEQLLTFADRFRMDNPLVKFGSAVYQPNQPINLTYDAFGPPAGFIRGLFEYIYKANSLTLYPHIPPGITRLEQRFPVRFGTKRLYLASVGTGPITSVTVNGKSWRSFDRRSVVLAYAALPERAAIEIAMGGAEPASFALPSPEPHVLPVPPLDAVWSQLKGVNMSSNALPLRIGADSNGQDRFHGDIASVYIFNRALGAEEIAALARNEPGPLRNDPALVGAWSFGQTQNGAFASEGGAGLRAFAEGRVETTSAPEGSAIHLDGTGYLEVPSSPLLDFTDTCTLAAWVRPESLPSGGGRILDKSEAGTSNGYLLDTYPGNSLRLITQAGTLTYDAKLKPGQWVHVAATVKPDGQLALYMDGKQVAHRANSAMPGVKKLLADATRLRRFYRALTAHGLGETYEAAHARLAINCVAIAHRRLRLLAAGKLQPLPNPASEAAANRLYFDTARKLIDGLFRVLAGYQHSMDPRKREISRLLAVKRSAAAARPAPFLIGH